MALIDEKIAQFKSEIGDMKMSEEQQIVFDLFCRTKGKPKRINTSDKDGAKVSFLVHSDKYSEGSQHVMLKHYRGKVGHVTAFEIIDMLDVVKKSKCVVRNFVTSYRLVRELGGVKYSLVLKMTTHVHVFKSFYSNRTNKKSLLNIQNPQSKSVLSCGSTPSCDATFGDVQKTTLK